MTTVEKAQELYNKFLNAMPRPETTNAAVYSIAKQCALIAVDELIYDTQDVIDYHRYWEEVKQQIEKL